jgi:hypothetical protein
MNKTFYFRFIDGPSTVLVELTNASEQVLKSIEVLTIFLKDKEASTGLSQAHIRFEGVKSMQPGEKTVLAHRTWINGKPAESDDDRLERLKIRKARCAFNGYLSATDREKQSYPTKRSNSSFTTR